MLIINFNIFVRFVGTFDIEEILGGLINSILSIISSLLWQAINTKEQEFPVTMTSAFSPITLLIKSVTNCTYKKFV